jgi:hypothetical protein
MSGLDIIKNNLINQISATKNEKLLAAIHTIFESSSPEEIITLSASQIEMLQMSERDIEQGDIVPDSELDNSDKKWLS